MSRSRRANRPADPLEITRRRAEERARARDPAEWGADAAALSLPANADVTMRADARGKIARARRQDVFDLFHGRGSLSQAGLDAVRRLQDDVATLHRTHSSAVDYTPRVDRSRVADGFTDVRRRAGERIESAMALTGAASARLLAALCEPDIVLGRPLDWRAVVQRETGERLPDAQGALLRAACENLAGAYAALERPRRRAGG